MLDLIRLSKNWLLDSENTRELSDVLNVSLTWSGSVLKKVRKMQTRLSELDVDTTYELGYQEYLSFI